MSSLPAFSQGKLHYGNLKSCKIKALREFNENFDKNILSLKHHGLTRYGGENLDSKVGVLVCNLRQYDIAAFLMLA